jgi:hypothetical protein
MMENGIYEGVSHADYHSITDRVSNSYLSKLAVCPAAARIPQEETQPMVFGKAFHTFILDGMVAFSRDVAISPEVNLRTNSGKEEMAIFRDANKGKSIITPEDVRSIMEMDKAIKAHPLAKNLIGTGTNEVSVFWDDPFSGLPCKARPDKVPGQKTLIDLKKTRDASPAGFQRAILTYGYHRQAAFYIDGMSNVTKETFDLFAFICVEDSEPYRVEVYTLSQDFIEYGRLEYKMLINIENQCRQKNEYPNYNSPQATEIDLPGWIRRKS